MAQNGLKQILDRSPPKHMQALNFVIFSKIYFHLLFFNYR